MTPYSYKIQGINYLPYKKEKLDLNKLDDDGLPFVCMCLNAF